MSRRDLVLVNDDTQLNAIYQNWFAAGCQGPGPCPQLSCAAPQAGLCAVVDGGETLCQPLPILPAF